jgi:hypothetical protein
MTDTARVVAGLACCGGLVVLMVVVWSFLAMAGRAGWDQDEGDG